MASERRYSAQVSVESTGPDVDWQVCDSGTCPCPDGECTLSRYARAVTGTGSVGAHPISATERAVAARLAGLDIDMTSMATVQNLYRAANAVRNHLEQTVLAPHQLTWTGWVVLWVVWIWEEIETRNVAVEAGISKGTLTGVVKTLEGRGLLLRHTHPSDARRVLLRLTPAGKRKMRRVFPELNREESAITERLGGEATSEMAHLLRAIAVGLEH
jgi:MarR family transcriptional regulator, organic hydroperoxide resistance regulator